jgi:hypothetical protein
LRSRRNTFGATNYFYRRKCVVTGGADKSLARLTSRCILFDGENILFDASLTIYINGINIPTIMIINRICLFVLLALQTYVVVFSTAR